MAPLTISGTWLSGVELISAGCSFSQACLGRMPMFMNVITNGA